MLGEGLSLDQRALVDFFARFLVGKPLLPLMTIVGDGEGQPRVVFSRQWLDMKFPSQEQKTRLLNELTRQFRELLEDTPREPTDA